MQDFFNITQSVFDYRGPTKLNNHGVTCQLISFTPFIESLEGKIPSPDNAYNQYIQIAMTKGQIQPHQVALYNNNFNAEQYGAPTDISDQMFSNKTHFRYTINKAFFEEEYVKYAENMYGKKNPSIDFGTLREIGKSTIESMNDLTPRTKTIVQDAISKGFIR